MERFACIEVRRCCWGFHVGLFFFYRMMGGVGWVGGLLRSLFIAHVNDALLWCSRSLLIAHANDVILWHTQMFFRGVHVRC